jgi:anti-sigma B factor antagonist
MRLSRCVEVVAFEVVEDKAVEPQPLECCLQVERRGDAVVARFTREVILSGSQAEEAAAVLMALMAELGRRPLLVDFGKVRSLTSLMLGKLIGLNRAAESAGARLAIFNLRPDVRDILEVTRLNLVLSIYNDEPDALLSP